MGRITREVKVKETLDLDVHNSSNYFRFHGDFGCFLWTPRAPPLQISKETAGYIKAHARLNQNETNTPLLVIHIKFPNPKPTSIGGLAGGPTSGHFAG